MKPGPPSALIVGKKQDKKCWQRKKKIFPHPQDTSPAEFRQVSAPILYHAFHGCISKGDAELQNLQNYHRSRSVDVSAGDTEFIGLKTHIFIYQEAIW